MSGWVLNLGRHTVTRTVRAAGAVGWKHISSLHRFFSQARWAGDELGLVLVRTRLDAAIYRPPPTRRPGQIGRPRKRDNRLPSPQQQAADPKAPWR